MKSYIKNYDLEITTLGAVFIGSGYNTNKKEALFGRKQISFIDTKKMFDYLMDKKLILAYQDYILDINQDLQAFFKNINIPREKYEEWITRKIQLADIDEEKGSVEQRGIDMFVRDSRGNVYVPGSSIKGMIRTILVGAYFLKNKDKSNKWRSIVDRELATKKRDFLNKIDSSMKRLIEDIETEVFNKNFYEKTELKNKVNDSLRGLIVSDSEIISDKNMCVCQKIDVSTSEKETKLPLFRECISPMTKINFNISIDTKVCPYTINDILEAIELVYKNNKEKFDDSFSRKTNYALKRLLYLGGGSGFVDKTIIYSLFDKKNAVNYTREWLNMQFPKAKHDNDIDVSPRKIKYTKHQNKDYRMGLCVLNKVHEKVLKD